ncbi:MAG: NADH-quinone oxidoreductase subunit N [Ignavibacteriaceae bacterium]|jgi:NADH-quinone oxidoreductase subunit N|nr:MAG: NADH-quinone oxidoreductase subunit N [Chlorobiota bacterium]KXK05902.1 MAG: NADH dehydrogenase subunit N [Chlorobi bacterium OLB4]MBV6398271.1 NAD(P)H-quinone oxidoreductase subunit 2, chloroplastic [Ignavibacteria bacterium]MCC6886136.1 NADH-quinone oxidoreductase subunit N [Ignavibacteriales bacterium]MCE7952612.1 NADH-quinone oxidoreductase subunit N [Chlorobi bacterium CHB7]MDL1886724.1 NADH-quinone oxidoreductase subunit N [Ignavibacteria bacterium CHB1]MEB2329608.1 NADH-quinone
MIQLHELQFIIPLITICVASVLVLIVEVFSRNREVVFAVTTLSVFVALIITIRDISYSTIILNNFININNVSSGFNIVVLLSVLLSLLESRSYLIKKQINFGEYYAIILFSLIGMMLMVMANDLLIVFLGLEMMSICFYILAGFMRKRIKSNESALKYFLLGAFMTGFLLYGITLIYGVSGTTNLMVLFSNTLLHQEPLFLIGVGLFLIGFLFKIGAFPFHMWVPDVYDGAPTIVSGFMSTAGKIAAVATIFPIILKLNILDYRIIISVVSVLTMMFGNIIALAQTNIKRLLAYSSIASAGYLLVGLAAFNDMALRGILFYTLAYSFMQLGAFIVVGIIEKSSSDNKDFSNISLDSYKGLAKRNPVLATIFTLFLFSLAGIPPFAGFWGKYYLFVAAIKANLIWLSIVAILLSVIGIYYYLKVIVYMWFTDPETDETYIMSPLGTTAIILSIAGTIFFGLFPEIFFELIRFY